MAIMAGNLVMTMMALMAKIAFMTIVNMMASTSISFSILHLLVIIAVIDMVISHNASNFHDSSNSLICYYRLQGLNELECCRGYNFSSGSSSCI